MNGATAEPEVKTIRLPNKTKHRTIGKSQNFFRSFMNPHNSLMNSYIGKPSDYLLITSYTLLALDYTKRGGRGLFRQLSGKNTGSVRRVANHRICERFVHGMRL
jgi:hypothetical protein